jgi:hypothetical protein
LFILLICCIAFSSYNKEFVLSLYTLTIYIVTHTRPNINNRTLTITIILLLIPTHTQTQLLTTYHTTKLNTHIHINQHLNNKSPTYPQYQNHTNNSHNNIPHTITNNLQTTITIIHNIICIGQISYITHLHLKTPKTTTIRYYTWNYSTIILLGGDIQPNPGPPLNISQTTHLKYKPRQKQHLIPNTPSPKPRYIHLEQLHVFSSYYIKFIFLLYKFTAYITTHTRSTITNRTPTIIIILLLILIHTQTHSLTPYNTTKLTTHIHISQHLHNITPTYPNYHNHTTNTHNNRPHTTINQPPTPKIIIHNITYIGQIRHITHLHLKTPKAKTTRYYAWNNSKIILLGGDIQPNPGPLSSITQNLPLDYKQRQKQYFTPNTTTLKPRCAHLESLFTPHLTRDTQNTPNQELPYLQRHKPLLSQYPIHLQIYALIITYSPIPQICNQRMITGMDPIGHTLLRKLHKLPNYTHSHIPLQTNPTYNPKPTTIAQAYTYINTKIATCETINIATLKNDLPHIPPQILQELIKCTLPIKGYHPNINPSQTTHTPHTTSNDNTHSTSQLKIITWNA